MQEGITRDIPDDEHIIRGIFTPFHYDIKKDKPKKEAFIQKPHSKGVSMYRSAIFNTNDCRNHAKNLINPGKKDYFALAVVSTEAVRNAGSRVEDTRDANFYGHADMLHDIPDALPQEPNTPENQEKLIACIDKILKCAKFYKDPDPQHEIWLGDDPITPLC